MVINLEDAMDSNKFHNIKFHGANIASFCVKMSHIPYNLLCKNTLTSIARYKKARKFALNDFIRLRVVYMIKRNYLHSAKRRVRKMSYLRLFFVIDYKPS